MIKSAAGTLTAFNFDKLRQNIPELEQLDCDIETRSFQKPIDSSNVNISHWVKIATIIEENYFDFDGFVVLHGSDTMSYSASALSFMLENLDKPVVFTGSQLPIGDLRTDAKENLITAIQIASQRDGKKAKLTEVGLYFEYKLYRGNRTTKINAEHFNAFDSPNYPALAESGVHLKFASDKRNYRKSEKSLVVHKNLDNNVAILKIFPGINENIVASILNSENLKGVVLETYGSGNAPTEDWFTGALKKAISKGIHIINVTQCYGGSVNMGQYETSTQLAEIGLISGKNSTTEAAICKLMYMLGAKVSSDVFKTIFETPLRGEIS